MANDAEAENGEDSRDNKYGPRHQSTFGSVHDGKTYTRLTYRSLAPDIAGIGFGSPPSNGYNVATNTREVTMLTADAIVRARIATEIKDRATIVLADMGLSVSDAIRLMLVRVANEKTLPFDVRPNAETIAAMEEARRGNLPSFATVDDLMADLNRAPD